MLLFIFDRDFNKVGQLDSYISLQWTEEYQGKGSLTLVCVDNERNTELLKQGYYLYQSGKRTAMVIRYLKHDSEDGTIEVHGYTTLDLLSQRIAYPMKEIKELEQGMYDLVKTFFLPAGSRKMQYLTTKAEISGMDGYNIKHETQFTGHEVIEAMEDLATEGELGFYMAFDWRSKRHIFTVYRGADLTHGQRVYPPKLFSVEYGNLQNLIITDDMTLFKNVAYVAGAGEGLERKYVVLGNAADQERYELYVDARDLQQEYKDDDGNDVVLTDSQYEANLIARGIEKLNDRIRAKSFSGEINPAGFGTEFYLGDKVTCKSGRYHVKLDARITKYTEVTEGNMTKLSVTLGDPELTIIEEVKAWL